MEKDDVEIHHQSPRTKVVEDIIKEEVQNERREVSELDEPDLDIDEIIKKEELDQTIASDRDSELDENENEEEYYTKSKENY